MKEIEIDGVQYRIGRLPAKQQFNVVRRLIPVLAAGGPAIAAWVRDNPAPLPSPDGLPDDVTPANGTSGLPFDVEKAFSAFGPLATAIGEMSDEASDYVIGSCLSVCQTNQNGAWARLAQSNGTLMFQDLGMATMLKLVMTVIQENMSDFLGALPGSSAAAP